MVDLNSAARRFFGEVAPTDPNPFLEPTTAQRCVDALHRERAVDWSFGGYLEERSYLLRGTYLDETKGYLHVGIDCNAPAGTPVATPFAGEIIDLFDDAPEPQGWGPRVIIATDSSRAPYLLLGHLGPHLHPIGKKLAPGDIIGEIGRPPLNGFWFPHLHIQIVSAEALSRLSGSGLTNLDGYGDPRDHLTLSADFPDPTWLITESVA